jgi:hypothetical protein
MPDYNNGKIYTIRFHNSNEIYIGSTIQLLAVRFGEHKRKGNSAVYKLINDRYEGNWSVCYYELYENYSCNSKEELCKKEGEVIRQFKNDENYDCINCVIIGRTKSEYKKDYNKNNSDKIKEQSKQYRDDNPDKIKEQSKQYREKNADKINEYFENNKEKIDERRKEKITCDCGSCINKGDLSQHYKSKKHQDYLASLSSSATVIYACDKCNA